MLRLETLFNAYAGKWESQAVSLTANTEKIITLSEDTRLVKIEPNGTELQVEIDRSGQNSIDSDSWVILGFKNLEQLLDSSQARGNPYQIHLKATSNATVYLLER